MKLEEVYRQRALRLAQRKPVEVARQTVPALVFVIGKERYGIELSELSEVCSYRSSTSVPGAHPAVVGVVNIRGEIRALVDVRRLLQLDAAEDENPGYVLMLRREGRTIGLKVDSVEEVRQLDPAQLVSKTGDAEGITHSSFVKAVTPDTLILLDVVAVLSHLIPGRDR
jgi:purine-binding chemotaxis protein CheW